MKTIDYQVTLIKIRKELKDYIISHKLRSLVLGVSGGIDSALVAAICKPVCDEVGIPLIGRSITIGTNKESEILRAKLIGQSFCTDFQELDMKKEYDVLQPINPMSDSMNESQLVGWKIRNGNIKARLRMINLYNLASTYGGLVLSTDNYTEYLLGFWTLHGDVGDYGMIQELWKTEVYELSEWIVNNELKKDSEKLSLQLCIDAVATDGLGITNSDLDQILPGFNGSSRDGYKLVDDTLIEYLNLLDELETVRSFDRQDVFEKIEKVKDSPVLKRHFNSEFKRLNPLNLKRKDII